MIELYTRNLSEMPPKLREVKKERQVDVEVKEAGEERVEEEAGRDLLKTKKEVSTPRCSNLGYFR